MNTIMIIGRTFSQGNLRSRFHKEISMDEKDEYPRFSVSTPFNTPEDELVSNLIYTAKTSLCMYPLAYKFFIKSLLMSRPIKLHRAGYLSS
jgi:hypothetical protein